MSLFSGVYAGIFASSRRDSHGTPIGITLGMPVKRFVPGSHRKLDRDPHADKNEETNWMKSGFAGSPTNPIFHFHLTFHFR